MAIERDKFGSPNFTSVIDAGVRVSADPIVDESVAYAVADLVGGKMEFTNIFRVSSGTGIIRNVIVTDAAIQGAELDLVLFNSDPTSTTFTDNAAFTLADNDLQNICATVQVTSNDYIDFADNAVAQTATPVDRFVTATSGTSLWGCLVSRSTPTYVASSDLSVNLYFKQN